MQSEMFEGLMPVPRLSCHQAGPGSEVQVTSLGLQFSKNSKIIDDSFSLYGLIVSPGCSEKNGSPLIILFRPFQMSDVPKTSTTILF